MVAGELLLKVFRRMHFDVVNGVATGGSDTTIIDTALNAKYQANKFKLWTAIIKKTSNGLVPQGVWAIISAYANTGTATFPTIPAAVESGDEYAFCKNTIPLYEMIELMKDGLQQLDKFENWDRSLTTADQTLRYTLPIAIKGSPINSIRLEDDQYHPFAAPNYHVENTAGGVAPVLVFSSQPTVGQVIAINYIGLHPEITAYSTYINELIHPDLAVASVYERAMFWKMQPKNKKIDVQNWTMAANLLEKVKRDHPIPMAVVEENFVPINIYNR